MAGDHHPAGLNGTIVRLQPLIDSQLRALAAVRSSRRRLVVMRWAAVGTASLAILSFLPAPSWWAAGGVALLVAACGWVYYGGRRMARDLDAMEAEIRRSQTRIARITRRRLGT